MSKHIKLKKRKDLLSLFDFLFVLGTETSTESYAYSINENGGMLALADSSSTEVAEDGLSHGYRASRITSGTVDSQFFAASNNCRKIDQTFLSSFKEKFSTELHKNLNDAFPAIPPISCGCFFFQCEANNLFTGYLSCGSVRLFLLTADGLKLLSPQEFSSVITDKVFTCSLPAILLAVSDRTFRSFDNPMDFEYSLLDTLSDSQTVEGWKSILTKRMLAKSGDSFQLMLGAFGFGSFKALQKVFSNRKSNLYWNFLSKETTATPYEAEAMNEAYNQNYLSFHLGFTPSEEDEEVSEDEI